MKPYNDRHADVTSGIPDMLEEVLTYNFSLFLGKDTDCLNKNW
jgi:L-rhamnose mutarotase